MLYPVEFSCKTCENYRKYNYITCKMIMTKSFEILCFLLALSHYSHLLVIFSWDCLHIIKGRILNMCCIVKSTHSSFSFLCVKGIPFPNYTNLSVLNLISIQITYVMLTKLDNNLFQMSIVHSVVWNHWTPIQQSLNI